MAYLEGATTPYKQFGPTMVYADYTEIEVGGIGGNIKLVGIREFEDTWMALIDPQYLDLKTGPMPFKVLESPDGLKYYTIRHETNGYAYLTDLVLRGDFIYRNPASATVIHSIPTYAFNG